MGRGRYTTDETPPRSSSSAAAGGGGGGGGGGGSDRGGAAGGGGGGGSGGGAVESAEEASTSLPNIGYPHHDRELLVDFIFPEYVNQLRHDMVVKEVQGAIHRLNTSGKSLLKSLGAPDLKKSDGIVVFLEQVGKIATILSKINFEDGLQKIVAIETQDLLSGIIKLSEEFANDTVINTLSISTVLDITNCVLSSVRFIDFLKPSFGLSDKLANSVKLSFAAIAIHRAQSLRDSFDDVSHNVFLTLGLKLLQYSKFMTMNKCLEVGDGGKEDDYLSIVSRAIITFVIADKLEKAIVDIARDDDKSKSAINNFFSILTFQKVYPDFRRGGGRSSDLLGRYYRDFLESLGGTHESIKKCHDDISSWFPDNLEEIYTIFHSSGNPERLDSEILKAQTKLNSLLCGRIPIDSADSAAVVPDMERVNKFILDLARRQLRINLDHFNNEGIEINFLPLERYSEQTEDERAATEGQPVRDQHCTFLSDTRVVRQFCAKRVEDDKYVESLSGILGYANKYLVPYIGRDGVNASSQVVFNFKQELLHQTIVFLSSRFYSTEVDIKDVIKKLHQFAMKAYELKREGFKAKLRERYAELKAMRDAKREEINIKYQFMAGPLRFVGRYVEELIVYDKALGDFVQSSCKDLINELWRTFEVIKSDIEEIDPSRPIGVSDESGVSPRISELPSSVDEELSKLCWDVRDEWTEIESKLLRFETRENVHRCAWVIAGGPASGKSELTRMLEEEYRMPAVQICKVNPDDYKKLLEYDSSESKALKGAAFTHEESSIISYKLRREIGRQSKNKSAPDIILDIVSPKAENLNIASGPGQLASVNVVIATCSPNIAYQRMRKRGEEGGGEVGRFVPAEVLLSGHKKVSMEVPKVIVRSDVYLRVFNTDGPRGSKAILIAEKERYGNSRLLRVYNIVKWLDFIRKTMINVSAKIEVGEVSQIFNSGSADGVFEDKSLEQMSADEIFGCILNYTAKKITIELVSGKYGKYGVISHERNIITDFAIFMTEMGNNLAAAKFTVALGICPLQKHIIDELRNYDSESLSYDSESSSEVEENDSLDLRKYPELYEFSIFDKFGGRRVFKIFAKSNYSSSAEVHISIKVFKEFWDSFLELAKKNLKERLPSDDMDKKSREMQLEAIDLIEKLLVTSKAKAPPIDDKGRVAKESLIELRNTEELATAISLMKRPTIHSWLIGDERLLSSSGPEALDGGAAGGGGARSSHPSSTSLSSSSAAHAATRDVAVPAPVVGVSAVVASSLAHPPAPAPAPERATDDSATAADSSSAEVRDETHVEREDKRRRATSPERELGAGR